MTWDRDGLAKTYDRYGGGVFRRARGLLGDDQAAKDVCQEVFLRLWRARPDFSAASPTTWLYQVTTNYCLNVIRDEKRRRALLEARKSEEVAPPPALPLVALLDGIPEELHEVAIYYYIDEMSQDEIALVLGLSQRTVSNRLRAFERHAGVAWGVPEAEVP